MLLEIMAGNLIASVFGYLIGSVSFSIVIVKIKTKKDVRDEGSKNAGATNASRILGKKWGIAIMIMDAAKIVVVVMVALALSQIPLDLFKNIILIIPGLFALIGHCWPIYYKFKGGKAVSCFMGLMFTVNYIMGFVMFFTWLFIVLGCKKVSIGSIVASLLTAILMWVPQISGLSVFDINGDAFEILYNSGAYSAIWYNKTHLLNDSNFDSFLIINLVTTIAMIILIARHRQNIIRLIKGKEPNFLKTREEKKKLKVNKNSDTKEKEIIENKEKEN